MSAEALVREVFARNPSFMTRGFLPKDDPLTEFPENSPLRMLDDFCGDLPEKLRQKTFRRKARALKIPAFPYHDLYSEEVARLARLYYVRVGFLASGHVHRVGQKTARSLPENIAQPLCQIAALLNRPPILSYDGYALYNWRRFDKNAPIALGNIDTFQNFVSLYDEHWFILVHVEIEAIAANILYSILRYVEGSPDADDVLMIIKANVDSMTDVLRRIPEKMSPDLYHETFRPYIASFKGVVYRGVSPEKKTYRGETGAQSSIMPLLNAFLKIPHQPTSLTDHLADMRNYMPIEHVALIEAVDKLPSIKDAASKETWDEALEAIAEFRKVHRGHSHKYIEVHGKDEGTGGTPYGEWLTQLRTETLASNKTTLTSAS
jgi:indoleamine 2,3-dioxygenase